MIPGEQAGDRCSCRDCLDIDRWTALVLGKKAGLFEAAA